MDRKNVIIAVLAILLLVSTSSSYLIYQQQQLGIGTQGDITFCSDCESGTIDIEDALAYTDSSQGTSSATANIVAVRSDTSMGEIGKVFVEIREGSGKVLVDTNPFIEPDTQYSVREAVEVAADFTQATISDKDIIISFDINGTMIGGPSAGAATTVALIAALEGKNVRQDVAFTGTIEEGGFIGEVGSVFEKAIAAEENDMTLFLVPYGQETVVYYEQQIEKRGRFGFRFKRVYYTPKEIDLDEYFQGKMAVEEVSTIGEVVSYSIE
jgi:predicted S18 family serine protease